jgi:hypothetical protein
VHTDPGIHVHINDENGERMTLPKSHLALTLAAAALAVGLLGASAAQPSSAEAGVSVYCNNIKLPGKSECTGATRTMYAVEGWGDSTSVCVSIGGGNYFLMCSGGPGQHVYSGFGTTTSWPRIWNNAWATEGIVHGRAHQP